MTSSDQNWKEKYLNLIDSNERQKKRFDDQQDSLKKALGRLSVAATGLDEELDKRLDDLRRQLRSSQPKPLGPLLSRLDASVVAYDSRRDQRAGVSLDALKTISEQLQTISRDKAADKGLKRFRRELKSRVEQQYQYSVMLKELADLQSQVIDSVALGPSGFWDKLKNKRQVIPLNESQEGDESEAGVEPAAQSPETVPEDSLPSLDQEQPLELAESESEMVFDSGASNPPRDQPSEEIEGQFLSRVEIEAEMEASLDRPRKEPAFSRISNHITRVLNELLEGLQPEACVAAQALRAQNRIARGLNWYELVPTLEDIRDLIMQAFLAAELNFQNYLQQLNSELALVGESLGVALEVQEQQSDAEVVLQKTLNAEIDVLEQTVQTADNVDELKTMLSGNIATLRSAVAQHGESSQSGGLLEEMKNLLTRVQDMEEEAKQQEQALQEERERAQSDSLTGLPNREAYLLRAEQEIERCRRYGHGLVLAVCDIDHFKSFNDNYGHQVGDRVLKLVARAISQRLRQVDFMARYGGEEFVVLLPETDEDGALKLLDEVRGMIAEAPLRFRDEPVRLTVSFGLSAFREDDDLSAVFSRADKALYQAKNDGRNKCCVFSQS
ncbi:GGDEF domain-containing protein [Pseudoteredinibacter isoporae]|uniref:diguanylate cyclase n=1 Tax=Pseudoteredinibacter isoporae TaxID=570281 RepID=A0A7X0MVR0_9GAMM|nr:GGDEF domain-containing protein [Pseudoteredinibacter isoporae]MBB6520114.1 diguanylate cyclase [Pseudoteredinibacter isoporae]NHO85686.1 GGDEF domain-containing protein [Pseudoteredinibacter isoporae]NIB25862.1 GGDEF domain-containing protein [Pseudoteredinibacter isoporae]